MIIPLLFLVSAILPPAIDDWKRTETTAAALAAPPEYGLVEAENARYEAGAKSFRLAVYRLKDNTGAVAFEQSLRSPEQPRKLFRHQNYVFETVEGTAPRGALDAFLLPTLPKVDRSAVPNLLRYLPAKNRITGSEKYILGPASLKAYAPRIPVGAAGFDFAGELQTASYTTPEGGAWLGVFVYPNQIIARQQAETLERALTGIPSAALKREGPLVAVVLPAPGAAGLQPETAQALTGPIVYKAEVMMDLKPPKAEPNPGDMLIGIFQLTGILLALCLGSGLAFAAFMAFSRRNSSGGDDKAMTSLRI